MMEVVVDGKHSPRIVGGKLQVTVVSDKPSELFAPSAKRLAYDFRNDERCKRGFENAGIEIVTGIEQVKVGDKQMSGRTFALTRGFNSVI